MMNFLPDDLSFFLCACAVALPAVFLCATSCTAQSQPETDAKAVVAKVDAARGKPSKAGTLVIEGNYAVRFEGAGDEPVAQGKFKATYAGADHARNRTEMGDDGAMENGVCGDLVWGLDPAMGAKVYSGAQAVTVRRHLALNRGVSPTELYTKMERTGTQEIDGRAHAVLRMTPSAGKPDTWYVDAESGYVTRIDIMLPAPESADAAFDMGDEIDSQLVFSDWKRVDGVAHPHRRVLTMGPAKVEQVCTKIEAGVEVDAAVFTPPEAVLKIKDKPSPKAAFDADGKPVYQTVEREAQSVASIRVKIKPTEISSTLAVLLPEVMQHLNASGAKMAGAPFSRYHAFSPTEIDLEAGIPVAKPITEKGRVKNSELPAGKTVTAWHVGPYEKLSGAHEALQAFVDANELKVRGGCWEVYWTDPGMVPDPAKWRTQLFQPIE